MAEFTLYNVENAPEGSKPLLEKSLKGFGMVPNLHALFAESPESLDAYQILTQLFLKSSLGTTEKHVVWLTINVYNKCHYCVPAHTMLAKGDNVEDSIIESIRNNESIADERLETLRQFTIKLLENRGQVSDTDVDEFLNAGFTKANIFDILIGLAHKTLSNFANHIAHTPVDEPFAKFAWDGAPIPA